MKEWNELLLHINEFVYMKEEEEIVICYQSRRRRILYGGGRHTGVCIGIPV